MLQVQRPGGDALNRLLRWSNRVCADHGLAQLYLAPPREAAVTRSKSRTSGDSRPVAQGLEVDCSDKFHFSIAWTLQQPDNAEVLQHDSSVEDALENAATLSVEFESVKVKIGNTVTSLPLDDGNLRPDRKGFLG